MNTTWTSKLRAVRRRRRNEREFDRVMAQAEPRVAAELNWARHRMSGL